MEDTQSFGSENVRGVSHHSATSPAHKNLLLAHNLNFTISHQFSNHLFSVPTFQVPQCNNPSSSDPTSSPLSFFPCSLSTHFKSSSLLCSHFPLPVNCTLTKASPPPAGAMKLKEAGEDKPHTGLSLATHDHQLQVYLPALVRYTRVRYTALPNPFILLLSKPANYFFLSLQLSNTSFPVLTLSSGGFPLH